MSISAYCREGKQVRSGSETRARGGRTSLEVGSAGRRFGAVGGTRAEAKDQPGRLNMPTERGANGTGRRSRAAEPGLPVVIQVVGPSGSGKTTVVEESVRRLVARGLRVGVVKHSHHPPDLPRKDTGRYRAAGAHVVVFDSTESLLYLRDTPPTLVRLLPVDVVLVEGYTRRSFGGLRLRIREPREAPGLVEQVLARAPLRRRRMTLELDGRRRAADPLWTFVGHLMSARSVREVRRP